MARIKSSSTVGGKGGKKSLLTSGSKTLPSRPSIGKLRMDSTRKRRFRPGERALREIRHYQRSTDLLLRKLPFARLIHFLLFLDLGLIEGIYELV